MKADRWLLPLIDGVFENLKSSTLFTSLTLSSRYGLTEIANSCEKLPVFITHYGLYQFKVMLFGPMIAQFTFLRLSDVVIRGVPFMKVYIDDVFIFS